MEVMDEEAKDEEVNDEDTEDTDNGTLFTTLSGVAIDRVLPGEKRLFGRARQSESALHIWDSKHPKKYNNGVTGGRKRGGRRGKGRPGRLSIEGRFPLATSGGNIKSVQHKYEKKQTVLTFQTRAVFENMEMVDTSNVHEPYRHLDPNPKPIRLNQTCFWLDLDRRKYVRLGGQVAKNLFEKRVGGH